MSAICLECGDEDVTLEDARAGWHTRISWDAIPRHDPRCEGDCRYCPIAEPEGPVQCGPVVERALSEPPISKKGE